MKLILKFIFSALFACQIFTIESHADAATHDFEIVVAKTYADSCPAGQQSCGQWSCLMKAKLTARNYSSEEVAVYLKFKHPITKEFATVAFNFASLTAGMSDVTTGTAYGPICRNLKFREATADCTASNPPCAGFTLIQISPSRNPKFPRLPNVKIEVP